MASTPVGDIPGARFHQANVVQNGTVASGGANSIPGFFGPLAHPVRVRNVWWTPATASNAATQTATFRRLTLVNGGTAGSGTAIIASLNLTATVASQFPTAFTVVDATGTTLTVASGSILYFSQGTVGGTDANGTVLAAGQFAVAYEVI